MHLVSPVPATPDNIASIYSKGSTQLQTDIPVPVNSYRILASEMHKAMARHVGDGIWKPIEKDLSVFSYTPRNANQSAFVSHLNDPSILLNVAIGPAGTGKSFLSVAYALAQYFNSNKNLKLRLSKPLVRVGNSDAIGTLPNGVADKIMPYLGSYETVLNKAAPSKEYIQTMIRKGDLIYTPLEFIRGETFEDCVFILDEAQNTTWHEINTLISRMGANSKLIILGDLNQIDIPIKQSESGLYKLVHANAFLESPISSIAQLETQYRSPICALAAKIHSELQAD